MKKIWLFFIASTFISSAFGQNDSLKMDSLSYSVGVLVAQSLKKQGIEKVDAASFTEAIQDVLSGNTLKIDLNQANQNVQKHMMAQQNQMMAQQKSQHNEAIVQGKIYLEENAKRPEVTTLPSGLQYEVVKKGSGPIPKANDKVTVHYHGTLLDGTVFDSSVDRGQPATFGVTQVIQGWVEALQLMNVGSKWKLFIPYDLAYGSRAAGPKIGPFSTLIFEVELLRID